MSTQTHSTTERAYGGTPADVRIRERREKLLAAAYEIIGTRGFRAATVRAVCAESGLSQRYYYEADSLQSIQPINHCVE